MDSQPSKADIEAVFHRLRGIPANKACFDCNAKNPTWSSVTYGVFICIDCSAVHRSLGVHLTFVRSTQLDTNWTWVQLRQMQLGGNANATQFFQQHNCITSDAQKKYNSRAAQLYRDKLHQLALNYSKNNSELHIHSHVEEITDGSDEREVDFFTEHENFTIPDAPTEQLLANKLQCLQEDNKNSVLDTEGPNVDLTITGSSAEPKRSTIGTRKPASKKSGFGGVKKGGLGATKVKTNFADLERDAEIAEETRLRTLEENAKAAALTVKEQEEREAAVRLAYKDLSNEQSKREEQVRRQDPKKADQMERLGMGVGARSGISHSALSDMHTIEQENVQPTQSTLTSLGKLRITDTDTFFDDYSFSSGFNMNRSSSSSNYGGSAANKLEAFLSETSSNGSKDKDKDNWVIVDDPVVPSEREREREREKPKSYSREKSQQHSSTDEAQKKFGNAKAISSEQFFTNKETDFETKANLSRFQGSSSISSADFFGEKESPRSRGNAMQMNYDIDMDDVKESVKQGVTKVAGKISSLANGVMSSLHERYGYQ